MKIYIDNIVFNLQKVGGISVYFSELINRLLASEFDVGFLEQKLTHSNILRNKLPIQKCMIIFERNVPVRLRSYFPIRLKLREKAIVHSSYYRTCYNNNAVNIVTVHDFNYEFYRHGIPKYVHSYIKGKSILNADGLICISNSTKKDLLNLYKDIDPLKIKVIYHGANQLFAPLDCSKIEDVNSDIVTAAKCEKLILYVGARVHHKNFNLAVETLSLLTDFKLIIVGSTTLSDSETSILNKNIGGRYTYFGNATVSELNYLYNKAFCLLYPSSYEGFGIPVLEAMQAGCPVVSTNCSSIPEVAGNAGLLVDTICPAAFVEKIHSLEDPAYRDKVINAGFEQAKKFSWDKTYRETIAFYHEVFNNKFGESRSSY